MHVSGFVFIAYFHLCRFVVIIQFLNNMQVTEKTF